MNRRVVQGQIRWMARPDQKRRPALIISRGGVTDDLSDVLVIPLTTTIRDLPTEIDVGPEEGLRQPCVANAQQIGEVPKAYLHDEIGRLAPGRWYEVCDAVAIAIGC